MHPDPDENPATREKRSPDEAAGEPDETASSKTLRDGTAPDEAALANQDVPTVVLRRAPRYRRFVLAGALVGLLVAVLVVALGPAGPSDGLGRGPVLVFLSLLAILVGTLLGALVAVLVDRSHR